MHSAYRASVDFDQSPITGKPRLFTVREANALLVEVEPLVAQMRDAARTAAVAGEIVQAFARRIADSGGGRPDAEEAWHSAISPRRPRVSATLWTRSRISACG